MIMFYAYLVWELVQKQTVKYTVVLNCCALSLQTTPYQVDEWISRQSKRKYILTKSDYMYINVMIKKLF